MRDYRLNQSDLKLLGAYFLLSIAWLTYRYIVEGYTRFEIITGLIGVLIKVSILLYIFLWLVQKVLIEKRGYLTFLVLACIALFGMGYLDLLRDYYTAEPPWTWNMTPGEIIVHCFYNTTPDLALPLGVLLSKRYYENKLHLVELQSAQKAMQLKVLRAQYDPHFLYNSLNTIDALIDHAPKQKVRTYVTHLASLYRYLIQNKEEDLIPVAREIALAQDYFYLIETRFGNDFRFDIDITGETEGKFVPNGALLTILENVVKHNRPVPDPIATKITVEAATMTITNNKSRSNKPVDRFGTGLENLKRRYALLSDQTLTIQEDPVRFSVSLPLLQTID